MAPLTKEELWSTGQDEDVEVNQRALIDKILARYSGEHTIFRELLQNSDDAGAQHVQVKFYSQEGSDALKNGETSSRLPNAKSDLMSSYVVSNDGIPFRDEDWKRLKKIAEGNPDEEKIGAFGVGFYSLFSVCDGPFVESGDKWMAFYWKDGKDQLLARSGKLPTPPSAEPSLSGNSWTNFTMTLREPSLLEGPLDLARFFVTSITFMRTVKKIDILVDGVKVFEVQKNIKSANRVDKKGLNTTSSGGMMTVQNVDSTGMTISVKIMKWLADTGFTPPPMSNPFTQIAKPARGLASMISTSFFGRYTAASPTPPSPAPPPPPAEEPTKSTTLLRDIQIFQANIKVSVSPAFGRELERATKKPAPGKMTASIVYSRDEDNDTKVEDGRDPSADEAGVFSGLCPKLGSSSSARVFIGQPTGQTTGIGGHLAARFIPTVERESIDLVDRHVSHWNRQLLWVGGYLCRLIYELEMHALATAWAKTTDTDGPSRAKLSARALHTIKFFTFKATTPAAAVGQEMEAAFYNCAQNNHTLPILSSDGIFPVKEVRMPNDPIAKFLSELPVITQSMLEQASSFIRRLQAQKLLVDITYDDVVNQLGKRPLTEKELMECLKWWQDLASNDNFNVSLRSRLLDAAIVMLDNGKVLPLSLVETFIRPHSGTIPPDMPIPQHTIPYGITKDLRANSIHKVFGWTELNLLQYVTFLLNTPMSAHQGSDPATDLRISPEFAERVLGLISRAWTNLPSNIQSGIALELKDVPCIPTKAGFKPPREAYFEKNLLFEDLPIISLPKNTAIKGNMEKMLLAIGVRKTVDLQLVFSRLIGGGTWGCLDLMKYLVSVKDTLSDDEIKRLKQTAAFPLQRERLPSKEGEGSAPPALVRQKPWQLYEPIDAFKEMGLPLLDWGDAKWRSNSEEAKMLFMLGLNRYPSKEVLLKIMGGPAPANEKALDYLLANFSNHYSDFRSDAFPDVAFLPATKGGSRVFVKPGEAFSNPDCAILGFAVAIPKIASPENASKLGVRRDPPMGQLVIALVNNVPMDIPTATRTFEYMSAYVNQTAPSFLADTHLIPVKTASDIRLHKPSQVYFHSKERSDNVYASAFTFVDFGDKANVFLQYCGVRREPSVQDIARLFMANSDDMLRQAGSPEKYLEQIRLLATNWSRLDSQTKSSMRSAKFLLASQLVDVKKKSQSLFGQTTEQGDEYEREWVLARAGEIVINDNIVFSQYFGPFILAAPEEALLENFYSVLGSQQLSSFVRTKHVSTPVSSQAASAQSIPLRRHVLERLTIFLTDRRKLASYSIDSLTKDGNFQVEECQSLKVQRTYKNGKVEKTHTESLYAIAAPGRTRGSIVLTVSLSAQKDDYDIASALCEILFKTQKADDALLLYSILTTPLMALRKRGINVDRILNQQKEEKIRLQAELRERDIMAAEKAAENTKTLGNRQSLESTIGSETSEKKGLFGRFGRGSASKDKEELRMPGGMPGIGTGSGLESLPQSKVLDELRHGLGGRHASGAEGYSRPGTYAPDQKQTARPTDLSDIRATVKKAMDASRPETATRIQDSRKAVNNVSEAQGDYCDTTAEVSLKLGE
ncbi:hypothetical protein L198_05116 [Cryptococcus wingfieldii CBS 7118]|uniref:Sacsin/Nov domain-containing protein n=1 Tax=Cryptococcus wingfieldii CBS 7118 TaxID=1295528 RepID=A0A1E3J050_9TREE|nr:hypothetical protein L198_05116 [Cryptococcus wingfieldii CBS 7118]ODN94260.1 hypothetical protein L198_05116 [Cryptococcus wingfieldii CBS 7118]